MNPIYQYMVYKQLSKKSNRCPKCGTPYWPRKKIGAGLPRCRKCGYKPPIT